MDLDQIYERIGGCGRQQKIYCGIIFLSQFLGAFHHVFLVFAGNSATFHCLEQGAKDASKLHPFVSRNSSAALAEACRSYESGNCGRIIYTGAWKTVTMEFDLICKSAYQVSFAQSVYMGGVLIGSLLFGFIADLIGRSRTVYVTAIVIVLSSFALGSSTSFTVFIALRFTIGFGVAGFALASYVLGSELIGQEVRGLYVLLTSSFFAMGICLLSGLAMICVNWRQLSNCLAILTLCFSLLYLKVPESPRWLVSQGRLKEAQAVISVIAIGNGSSANLSPDSFDLKMPVSESNAGSAHHNSENIGSLFRHWTLGKWTLIQFFSWFANSAVYYGLTMASGGLSDSLYVSVALSGVAELPAYLLTFFLQRRLGRRTLVCGNMIVGGLSCALIMFVRRDQASLRTGLALLGKMGISASFALIYLHSTELFPTTMRNAALGVCSMSARIGGVIAPFISMIGNTYPSKEFVVFGAIGLLSGILNMQLPETAGKPLPESVSDVLQLRQRTWRSGKVADSSAGRSVSPLISSRRSSPDLHDV